MTPMSTNQLDHQLDTTCRAHANIGCMIGILSAMNDSQTNVGRTGDLVDVAGVDNKQCVMRHCMGRCLFIFV